MLRRKRKKQLKLQKAFMLSVGIIAIILLIVLSASRDKDEIVMSLTVSDQQSEGYSEMTDMQLQLCITEEEAPEKDVISDNAESNDGSLMLSYKSQKNPAILIYHTHTLESYTQTAANRYKEYSGRWRTNDTKHSIVAVGEKLADELRALGYTVYHDTTDHEPPKLSTAYDRSVLTMKKYKEKYPDIVLYIDLHRDASDESNTSDYCLINGEKTAKVMCVVGHGTKYDDKPDFKTNYSAAQIFTEYLRKINPSLGKSIREKPGRYNQHIGKICMLIEIGHNMNTLEQAFASTPYVAKGIDRVLKS